jgi:hypothetical protein
MKTKAEVLSSYGFTTTFELVAYMVDSYLNGQKKQAKEIKEELSFFEWSEVKMYLSDIIHPRNVGLMVKIYFSLGYTENAIENIVYNKDAELLEKAKKELYYLIHVF